METNIEIKDSWAEIGLIVAFIILFDKWMRANKKPVNEQRRVLW